MLALSLLSTSFVSPIARHVAVASPKLATPKVSPKMSMLATPFTFDGVSSTYDNYYSPYNNMNGYGIGMDGRYNNGRYMQYSSATMNSPYGGAMYSADDRFNMRYGNMGMGPYSGRYSGMGYGGAYWHAEAKDSWLGDGEPRDNP